MGLRTRRVARSASRVVGGDGTVPIGAKIRLRGMSAGSTDATQGASRDVLAELLRLRSSIDNLDAALVHVLAERFRCTQQVGILKAANHMPPADPEREAQQIERLRRLAAEAKLDPEFAEKFLNFVIAEVLRHHEAIASPDA
jgi:chorismate mutase